MNNGFMVETEFLFGFQPKDRLYNTVSKILKAHMASKKLSVYYPVSALIEVREVMASHGKSVDERLNALTRALNKGEGNYVKPFRNKPIFRRPDSMRRTDDAAYSLNIL